MLSVHLRRLEGIIEWNATGNTSEQRGSPAYEIFLRFGHFLPQNAPSITTAEKHKVNCWEAILVAACESLATEHPRYAGLFRHFLLCMHLETFREEHDVIFEEYLKPLATGNVEPQNWKDAVKGKPIPLALEKADHLTGNDRVVTLTKVNLADPDHSKNTLICHMAILNEHSYEEMLGGRKTLSLTSLGLFVESLRNMVKGFIRWNEDGNPADCIQWRLTEYDLSVPNLLKFCSTLDSKYRQMFKSSLPFEPTVLSSGAVAYGFWLRRKQIEEEKAANFKRMKQVQLWRQKEAQLQMYPNQELTLHHTGAEFGAMFQQDRMAKLRAGLNNPIVRADAQRRSEGSAAKKLRDRLQAK